MMFTHRVFLCCIYFVSLVRLNVEDTFLVPADASATSIELNGYPLSTFYNNVSQIQSKSTTVILEACFSGNSVAGTVIQNASPVYHKIREVGIPANLNVITAGAANQLASWTKDKQHSLFTYHYLKGMRGAADSLKYGDGNGIVTPGEIKAYLDDTVTYYARREYGRDQNVQIILAADQ